MHISEMIKIIFLLIISMNICSNTIQFIELCLDIVRPYVHSRCILIYSLCVSAICSASDFRLEGGLIVLLVYCDKWDKLGM